jgi:hypothetical protein
MTYEAEQVTIIAQRVRIAELEQQLADADTLTERLCKELRDILAGCGSIDEQLRATVPMVKLQAFLAVALARVPAVIERNYIERPTGKIIDLGPRIKRRPNESCVTKKEE